MLKRCTCLLLRVGLLASVDAFVATTGLARVAHGATLAAPSTFPRVDARAPLARVAHGATLAAPSTFPRVGARARLGRVAHGATLAAPSTFPRVGARARLGRGESDESDETEVQDLRNRMARLEALVEKVLYCVTHSDDIALLERDTTRTLIVDSGLVQERPVRLLRASLLAIMRQECMPLPPGASAQDPGAAGSSPGDPRAPS